MILANWIHWICIGMESTWSSSLMLLHFNETNRPTRDTWCSSLAIHKSSVKLVNRAWCSMIELSNYSTSRYCRVKQHFSPTISNQLIRYDSWMISWLGFWLIPCWQKLLGRVPYVATTCLIIILLYNNFVLGGRTQVITLTALIINGRVVVTRWDG